MYTYIYVRTHLQDSIQALNSESDTSHHSNRPKRNAKVQSRREKSAEHHSRSESEWEIDPKSDPTAQNKTSDDPKPDIDCELSESESDSATDTNAKIRLNERDTSKSTPTGVSGTPDRQRVLAQDSRENNADSCTLGGISSDLTAGLSSSGMAKSCSDSHVSTPADMCVQVPGGDSQDSDSENDNNGERLRFQPDGSVTKTGSTSAAAIHVYNKASVKENSMDDFGGDKGGTHAYVKSLEKKVLRHVQEEERLVSVNALLKEV
jgi:hypothetical protein